MGEPVDYGVSSPGLSKNRVAIEVGVIVVVLTNNKGGNCVENSAIDEYTVLN
jgi:hypothetical protein